MAAMLGNLYSALIEAGASPDKAQAAAEEATRETTRHDPTIADLLYRMKLMQWMMGLMIALNLAIFYRVWGF